MNPTGDEDINELPKEVLLSQFSYNLSSYIYFNYAMSDFNEDRNQVNYSIYKDTFLFKVY